MSWLWDFEYLNEFFVKLKFKKMPKFETLSALRGLNICIWPEKSKYFETPSQNFPLITSFKTSLIMLVTEVRMERMFLITSMHPLNTNKVAENLRCIDIFPITISFTFKFEFNLLYCLIMYFYQSLP